MSASTEDRAENLGATPTVARLSGIARRLQATSTGRNCGITLLALLLAFLSVYPLSMLLYGSLHSTPPGVAGTFTLDGYRDVFTQQSAITLLNTVGISFAKTIPSLVLAVLLAWILARTDTPFRGALESLITLPFFIPPILTAMAWGMLGNPQVGLLNQVYQWVTGSTVAPINVYSYGGVVWHMMQYAVPFLFLLIVDAFRAMDPSLEEAARMCGASRLRTFSHGDAATDAARVDRGGNPELHSRHRKFRSCRCFLARQRVSGSSRRTSTTRSTSGRRRNINMRPQSASSSWRYCS